MHRLSRAFLFAVFICLATTAVDASHITGGYVYPTIGWDNIGLGHDITYGLNANLPIDNSAGANVRDGVRQATDLWNQTRYRNTTPAPAYATEVSWDWSNQIQYNNLNGGLGWIPSGYVNGNCQQSPPYPSVFCFGEINGGNDNWMIQSKFVGGHMHELGHALGSLADHTDYNCFTIMSSCSWDMSQPSPTDVLSMKTVYGIPNNPTMVLLNYVGLVRLQVENRSSYDDVMDFDLYKWDGASYNFLRTYSVYGYYNVGDFVTLDLNLLSSDGNGYYIVGAFVHQNFPNGYSGWQTGGYSDYLYVPDAPYKSFIPLVTN